MLGASNSKPVRSSLPLLLPTVGHFIYPGFSLFTSKLLRSLVLGVYLYQTLEVLIYIEYNHKLNFDCASMLRGLQLLFLAGSYWSRTDGAERPSVQRGA